VFENRVLRKVFEPNRDKGTLVWRKLHNEELRHLYLLFTKVEMGGAYSMNGEKRNAYILI
jgi:hypothetical protein